VAEIAAVLRNDLLRALDPGSFEMNSEKARRSSSVRPLAISFISSTLRSFSRNM
jgi:hypothetical protein